MIIPINGINLESIEKINLYSAECSDAESFYQKNEQMNYNGCGKSCCGHFYPFGWDSRDNTICNHQSKTMKE